MPGLSLIAPGDGGTDLCRRRPACLAPVVLGAGHGADGDVVDQVDDEDDDDCRGG